MKLNMPVESHEFHEFPFSHIYILKFFSFTVKCRGVFAISRYSYQQMQQLCKGNLGPSALTVLRLGGAHLGGYGEAPDSACLGGEMTWDQQINNCFRLTSLIPTDS